MTPEQNKSNASHSSTITLAIDIGGSGIKGILLNQSGQPVSERVRMTTPKPATPQAIVPLISEIAKSLGRFDRVSVGFPGVIHQGLVKTAPNLDASWPGTDLVRELKRQLKKPVRAANDADVQGYGAIKGQGVELVITLGTGFGTALFINGHLVPNLEIAHHPFRKQETYEVQLGANALKMVGKKRWNLRLAKAIELLDRVINFDQLYLGGGNAKKVTMALPSHATIVSNTAGLLGGIALWADPNVILPPVTKGLGKGTARKRAPRRTSSKTLQKKEP
ncbi:MAG: ROK family protein [Nitrospirota bacterium]|nr:ROK family protein [Nitrospirota bacterium]MDH5575012.1 ROK family protein [Nitrospirota bacterium]MDH5701002.1 ROK family protein [Nitrospirota bacterium]